MKLKVGTRIRTKKYERAWSSDCLGRDGVIVELMLNKMFLIKLDGREYKFSVYKEELDIIGPRKVRRIDYWR